MTLTRVACALACLAMLSGPAAAQDQRRDTATATGKPNTEPNTGPGAWDRVAGNWKLFKGKVRKQWGKLTRDDLAIANGRREELVGRIRARYGIDKAAADAQVGAWLKAQK